MFILADRKIWAAVQMRRGPNVVGPFGLLQTFADAFKFMFKEVIVPSGANKVIFFLAPMVTAALAFAGWAVVPMADHWVVADINVGMLYLFAVSSLGVYGIIMGGWASNSKYPVPLRAALRRPDGVLRSLHRLRDHHRAAVRGFAESLRHRARAGAWLVRLHDPVPDAGDLLRLGAGGNQAPALRSRRSGIRTGRRLLRRIFRRRRSCSSSSANTSTSC